MKTDYIFFCISLFTPFVLLNGRDTAGFGGQRHSLQDGERAGNIFLFFAIICSLPSVTVSGRMPCAIMER